jgi:hypothetical protein
MRNVRSASPRDSGWRHFFGDREKKYSKPGVRWVMENKNFFDGALDMIERCYCGWVVGPAIIVGSTVHVIPVSVVEIF